MTQKEARSFSVAVALCSLLLTMVVVQAIWESYYPPYAREALRERRAFYEKVLLPADLSSREGLYYKVLENSPEER
jgi:hypothetical protein